MVVRTGLQNIPILSSLPDIPNLYASNPNFSFIVDLIVLCVMFGAILVPLGQRVLGSKKSGKQFGAVLGIIFGASAAFALNAAGVGLFKYWLTILFLGIVLSVIFYKILMALHVSKGLAGFICLALAWILLDLAFIEGGLGSDRVQTGFGTASILFVILAAISLIVWFIMHGFTGGGRGGGEGGGGSTTPPAVIGPAVTPPGVSEDEARLRHELERANAVAAASEREDAAAVETEKAATDAAEGAKEVVSAGDEGARIAEEFKTALNVLLTMIVTLLGKPSITKEDLDRLYAEIITVQKKYASFNSPLNKLRAGFGKIQSFEKKINTSIAAHNTLKTAVDSWDLSQLKARIDSLSPQERAPLTPKYNDLNKKIMNLKAIIVSVEATITRMQTEHLPFLAQVKLQTEYAALSQYFARITTSLKTAVEYIKPVIEAYARQPDTPPQNRAKNTLENMKPLFEQILTVDVIKLKASWETLAATQSARYEQIKSDISTWTRAYAKVKKQGIAVITSSITTINTLVVEAEQRQRGAATRQQAVQQGAATTATPLAEALEEIYAIKKKLKI